MMRNLTVFLIFLCAFSVSNANSQEINSSISQSADDLGAVATSLPLPRFASLKSDNVYVRAGPSMDYPIKWIYKKEGLPVEIVQEFDSWRKIKDDQGGVGWVHKILLTGKKTASINSADLPVAYNNLKMDRPMVKFEKGVIVSMEECQKLMCRVLFTPYEGWIEKKYLWGVYGSEIFK